MRISRPHRFRSVVRVVIIVGMLWILVGCEGAGTESAVPIGGKWVSVDTFDGPNLDIVLSLTETDGSVEGDATIDQVSTGEFDAVVSGRRNGSNVELTLKLSDGRTWEFSGETRTDPVRMVGTLIREDSASRIAFGRVNE